jgi:hypothetical protein
MYGDKSVRNIATQTYTLFISKKRTALALKSLKNPLSLGRWGRFGRWNFTGTREIKMLGRGTMTMTRHSSRAMAECAGSVNRLYLIKRLTSRAFRSFCPSCPCDLCRLSRISFYRRRYRSIIRCIIRIFRKKYLFALSHARMSSLCANKHVDKTVFWHTSKHLVHVSSLGLRGITCTFIYSSCLFAADLTLRVFHAFSRYVYSVK